MKTSNKILLGVFVAGLLLTLGINLVVYAKFKRGEFVPFNRDHEYMSKFGLPAARYVSITALGNVELINSDTARYEIRKKGANKITYRMVNDTLVIHGDTSLAIQQLEQGSANYQTFKLYLPASVQVNTSYTGVMVKGKEDSTKAPSFNIRLGKSSRFNLGEEGREYVYLNQLVLLGDDSKIELLDRAVVNNLSLTLINNSSADTKRAELRGLKLDVDGRSTVNLSGYSIKSLK